MKQPPSTPDIAVGPLWEAFVEPPDDARSGEVFEPMTVVFEASADPLPAGLGGPVRLIDDGVGRARNRRDQRDYCRA